MGVDLPTDKDYVRAELSKLKNIYAKEK